VISEPEGVAARIKAGVHKECAQSPAQAQLGKTAQNGTRQKWSSRQEGGTGKVEMGN